MQQRQGEQGEQYGAGRHAHIPQAQQACKDKAHQGAQRAGEPISAQHLGQDGRNVVPPTIFLPAGSRSSALGALSLRLAVTQLPPQFDQAPATRVGLKQGQHARAAVAHILPQRGREAAQRLER